MLLLVNLPWLFQAGPRGHLLSARFFYDDAMLLLVNPVWLFQAGLSDAEQHGWLDDVETYREALAHIDELRTRESEPAVSRDVLNRRISPRPADDIAEGGSATE